jgi:hypothetical protein
LGRIHHGGHREDGVRQHAGPCEPSELERAALRREILAQAEEIGSRAPEAGEEVAQALVEDALSALRGRRG